MNPSQRIKIIQAVAKKLASEDWPVIDLTLRQFSLPWTDNWGPGDSETYVIEMLDNAPDDSLLTLAGHVGLGPQAIAHQLPSFWKPGHFKLFLAHISAFKRETADLALHLSKWHISAFVAHEDIEPTAEWQNEIERALWTMDALVSLLTPDFHDSKWTDQEVGVCLGRGLLALPVRLQVDPYGLMGKYQAVSGYGKEMSVLAEELFHILRTHELTRDRMVEALVYRFVTSISFKGAKENVGYLEELPHISGELLSAVARAATENNQIVESWGVPARVQTLLRKHGSDGV